MDRTQYTTGVEVVIKGLPETPEQFDQMAEEAGACLESALNEYVFRGWLNPFRAKLAEKVESTAAETGVPTRERVQDGEKTVLENPGKYLGRVATYLEGQNQKMQDVFGALAQEVADAIPVSLKGRVRTGGAGPKLAKKWLEAAATIISSGKLEAFCAKFGVSFADDASDDEKTTVIGRRIKEVSEEIAAKAAKEAMAV